MTETIGSTDTTIASTVITMSGMNMKPVLTFGGKRQSRGDIVSLLGGTGESKTAIGTGVIAIPITTRTDLAEGQVLKARWCP
jgi:hypothetical protein